MDPLSLVGVLSVWWDRGGCLPLSEAERSQGTSKKLVLAGCRQQRWEFKITDQTMQKNVLKIQKVRILQGC